MRIHYDLSYAVPMVGTNFDRSGASPIASLREFCGRFFCKKTVAPQPDESVLRITSPLSGTVHALSRIDDPIFSSEALGKGCAIEPTSGEVYAPFSGVVSQLAETSHAIGITGENGVELLIHVGMDTIELGGRFFEPKVRMGDHVEKGQLLLRFEMQRIAAEGYSLVTPVVITNTDDYSSVQTLCAGKTVVGRELLAVCSASSFPI